MPANHSPSATAPARTAGLPAVDAGLTLAACLAAACIADWGKVFESAASIPLAAWIVAPALSWIPTLLCVAREHHRLRASRRSQHLGATARELFIAPWRSSLPGISARGGEPSADADGERIASRACGIAAALCAAGAAGIAWAYALPPGPPTFSWLAVMASTAALSGCARLTSGFGPRELAAGGLWHLWGVAFEPVLAGGLPLLLGRLTQLAWGVRVAVRQQSALTDAAASGWRAVHTVSVVMPVLNEEKNLAESVSRVRRIEGLREIIVVDGGSRDATTEVALSLGCHVIASPPGRGGQLRRGAELATGDAILFLHADTWVGPEAGGVILRCLADTTVVGAGFWKRFREPPWLLLGSRPKCCVRVFLGRRIVGDMAFFVRRDALERLGGAPDMELMEDFELSARLRRIGRLALADGTVSTSARRFRKHGVLKAYWIMWKVTQLYRLGCSPEKLRRIYG